MNISSPDFSHAGEIPMKFAVEGENVSPTLHFSDLPIGTKTLALLVEDPDVPRNLRPDGLWTHWLIWNMPPETDTILSWSIPPGVVGPNGRGMHIYGGPNPPNGMHRYFFRLFALDCDLKLPSEASRDDFLAAIKWHVIDEAQLMGTYIRSDFVG